MDTSSLKVGVVAGLVAGVAFGALMGIMGMLPMVAALVGASSALVGFGVHLVVSAIFGAGFALVLGKIAQQPGRGIPVGLVYGLAWWFLGPLLIMPISLGMGSQLALAAMKIALPSLWGHLVYGFILGLVYQRVTSSVKLGETYEPRKSPA